MTSGAINYGHKSRRNRARRSASAPVSTERHRQLRRTTNSPVLTSCVLTTDSRLHQKMENKQPWRRVLSALVLFPRAVLYLAVHWQNFCTHPLEIMQPLQTIYGV